MRIIEPSFKIEAAHDLSLQRIERAGRTCYKSEDAITLESAKAFCARILKRGHESVIEHSSATVRIICDRGVSHEIVRHRLASYSQESTRYCNYGKDEHINFIKPCFWPSIPLGEHLNAADAIAANDFKGEMPDVEQDWMYAMDVAEQNYFRMLEKGAQPQEARSVLPNSLKTEIVMTANLREWRHFFKLRTANAAHPQMREIARPMLEAFQDMYTLIFDDIVYN